MAVSKSIHFIDNRTQTEEIILLLTCHFPALPIAQVDVLSAALRASSLDAREEACSAEKRSDVQDELGANELPNCKINHDASVPLINNAVEVTNSVKLSRESSLNQKSSVGE